MADGAFVPLMNSCLEENHVRKICALKGIVIKEQSSSLQLKIEDVYTLSQQLLDVKNDEPKEEAIDSVDEKMDEADMDIEAEVKNTRGDGHGDNKKGQKQKQYLCPKEECTMRCKSRMALHQT